MIKVKLVTSHGLLSCLLELSTPLQQSFKYFQCFKQDEMLLVVMQVTVLVINHSNFNTEREGKSV